MGFLVFLPGVPGKEWPGGPGGGLGGGRGREERKANSMGGMHKSKRCSVVYASISHSGQRGE